MNDLSLLNNSLQNLEAIDPTISFGTSLTVYISIPDDASSTCGTLGLPNLSSGYTYNCVSTANLTKTDGTGWVPVNFTTQSIVQLSALPIDPTNTPTDGLYYTYTPGGSWHLRSILESSKYQSKALNDGGTSDNAFETGTNMALAPAVFPNNWIKVPGSSTYNTSDFWVMKYEAKYDKDNDGKGDATSYCRYGGYNSISIGCVTGGSFISSAYGFPVATAYSASDANNACSSTGAHLVTNNEWMTIARNVEQVDSNWTGGSVGSGKLFIGNYGYCYGVSNCYTFSGTFQDYGTNRNSRAKLTLSNKEEIYDFSGNMAENVKLGSSFAITEANHPDAISIGDWANNDFLSLTSYGDFSSYDNLGPSDDSWTNASQGVGYMYHCDGCSSGGASTIIRGGSVDSQAAGAPGIYTIRLRYIGGDYNAYSGFRCAK